MKKSIHSIQFEPIESIPRKHKQTKANLFRLLIILIYVTAILLFGYVFIFGFHQVILFIEMILGIICLIHIITPKQLNEPKHDISFTVNHSGLHKIIDGKVEESFIFKKIRNCPRKGYGVFWGPRYENSDLEDQFYDYTIIYKGDNKTISSEQMFDFYRNYKNENEIIEMFLVGVHNFSPNIKIEPTLYSSHFKEDGDGFWFHNALLGFFLILFAIVLVVLGLIFYCTNQ